MNQLSSTTTKLNSNLGIRNKLFIGFGMIMLILIIASSIVLLEISRTEASAKHTLNYDFPIYDAFLNVDGNVYNSIALTNAWLLTKNPAFKNRVQLNWIDTNNLIKKLDDFSSQQDTNILQNWQNTKSYINKIKDAESKLLNAQALSDADIQQAVTTELMPLLDKTVEILDGNLNEDGSRTGGIFDFQLAKVNNGTYAILNNINEIKTIEYILMASILILSIIIALVTANKILKPVSNAIDIATAIANGKRDIDIVITSNDETAQLLKALDIMQTAIKTNEDKLKESEINTRKLFDNIVQTAMKFSAHSSKVSKGDLTERISVSDNNEMNQLGTDLNSMTESLASITKQITTACHNMVSMLTEVKHAVDSQSSGASEQASSINQITASLEEIEKSSAQTIEKAKQLGEVAERTRIKGEMGLNSVEQSVNGMKLVKDKVQVIAQTILDLSNQTQQVGEITAVVNTLSQQSKMLALNASIEAAKAGDAGKGFAVVASEVKNLAEQSEQSTMQVQKILEDIRHATEKAVMVTEEGTKGVDHGMSLVEQNGEVIKNLIDVIHEATIASQQIEAAIRQEGIGIEQITAGMNEINQVSSSSIASVQQTTEAIDNLALITKNLKEQIDIYKV